MEVIVKSLLLETPRSPHSTSDFHAATKAIGNCILNQCPIKLTQCPIKLPEKPTDAEAQSPSELLSEYGANFARKLLSSGRSIKEVALILVGTASAFVANTTTAVCNSNYDYVQPKANEAILVCPINRFLLG